MKFCSQCGKQNEDRNKFCQFCGTPFEEPIQPQQEQNTWQQPQQEQNIWQQSQPQQGQNNWQQTQPQQNQNSWQQTQQQQSWSSMGQQPWQARTAAQQVNQQAVAPATPAIGVVKQFLSSSAFLVAVILYSVVVFFDLINVFAAGSVAGLYGSLLNETGMGGSLILFGLIGLIPTALICAGLWLLFVNGRDTTKNTVNPQGMTLIKVGAIINLIVLCIALFFAIIVCFVGMIAISSAKSNVNYYYYGSDFNDIFGVNSLASAASGIFVLFLILLIALIVFMIFYYIKIFKTIDTVKNTMLSGQPNDQISMFVIVMCYIGGAVTAISALFSIVSSFTGFLSNGCSAAFMFIIAYNLSVYKNQMTAMKYPNGFVGQQSPYQQPPQF